MAYPELIRTAAALGALAAVILGLYRLKKQLIRML